MSSLSKALHPLYWSRHLMLSAAVLSLSACQTLGNLKPEATRVDADASIPVAPDWVEFAPDSLPQTDWVASFGDLQLTALVEEALQNNTSISAAAARLDAALSRADISAADLLPSVSGSGGLSRTENGNDLLSDRTGFSAGLNASWEVDVWGRLRDQLGTSELEAAATSADLAAARLSIAGQVSQAWFDLIEARLLTDLSLRDVETQERAQRLTLRRFESGVTGSSDVRLANSAVANSKSLQAQRRQQRDATGRRLEILLRRYPANALEQTNDFPILPVFEGAGTPTEMLARRPDILAAERRLSGQGLQVDVARKALLPRLTLGGDINAGANSLGSLFDIDALIASVSAGLTAPIFQGGRLKANVEQQEALLRLNLEQYAGVALQAYVEVENAIDGETRLAEREAALRVAVEESRKAEERIETRYTEGLATILQLLDAQSRRLSAEGQLISARSERLSNRVRMHVALGGGLYGAELAPLQTAQNGN